MEKVFIQRRETKKMKIKKIIAVTVVLSMAFQSNVSYIEASTKFVVKPRDLHNLTEAGHTLSAGENVDGEIKKAKNDYFLSQDQSIKTYLNKEEIYTDTPPCIIDGTTYVPARSVFENMGLDVEWKAELKSVVLTGAGFISTMYVDSVNVSMKAIDNEENIKTYILDKAPMMINSRVMIPLRGVAELYGASLDWDLYTKRIDITYPA